jgi:hypothetical protein
MPTEGSGTATNTIRSDAMKIWRLLVQAIGATIIIVSAWGSYWFMLMLVRNLTPLSQAPDPEAPYFRSIFLVMSVIEAIFLTGFAVIAVNLFRMKSARRAVKAYTWISILLVLYMFMPGFLWGLTSLGGSIATATGVGCVALAPFLFYPAHYLYLAVTVTLANLAMWRLGKKSSRAIDESGAVRA